MGEEKYRLVRCYADLFATAMKKFANFFVDAFGRSMQRLGYRWEGVPTTRVIKNKKQSPIYHLAFFSRHPLGVDFWDKCKESTAIQPSLF